MSLIKRLKNIWELSKWEVPKMGERPSDYPAGTQITTMLKKPREYAEFIEPVSVNEIFKAKPDATIMDVIKN